MTKRRYLIRNLLFVCVTLGLLAGWYQLHQSNSLDEPASQPATKSARPAFDKNRYQLGTPTSPWVIVNKQRPLQPADYAPGLARPNVPLRLTASDPEMQLSPDIKPATEALFAAARQAGLELILVSAYRSYAVQSNVYAAEVRSQGQAAADRQSARPGHSEHQTGLAIDVGTANRQCELQTCFADSPAGRWVAGNAHKHGFIIRYDKGREATTGYSYEPWHLRYVGPELANEIYRQGNIPLESFFNIGPAAGY